ncbi:BamA/TamA family outer membrane protein [candidate division KSB1 bacterium]|nr:BamA/TamA family outer membrane protein [candidate division KSB1 bacterium]
MKKNVAATWGIALVLAVVTVSGYAEQEKKSSLTALPYAFYTPETDFAVGFGAVYAARSASQSLQSRPSSHLIAATYTLKHQIVVNYLPEIYLRDESIIINGLYGFFRFPDKFWGIGNRTDNSAQENYESDCLRFETGVQKRIAPGWYVGVTQRFERLSIRETQAGGLLASGAIPGGQGGQACGFGLVLNRDTRNHLYYPTAGRYIQLFSTWFEPEWGSDFRFHKVIVDWRSYRSISKRLVLASQVYSVFTDGTPPFQMQALLGGSTSMRGYYAGRFRDKNLIAAQVEARLPLFWRLGVVAFAGAGQVAPEFSAFSAAGIKWSGGMGFRLLFDRQETINARLDIGLSEEGELAVYAVILEAF